MRLRWEIRMQEKKDRCPRGPLDDSHGPGDLVILAVLEDLINAP